MIIDDLSDSFCISYIFIYLCMFIYTDATKNHSIISVVRKNEINMSKKKQNPKANPELTRRPDLATDTPKFVPAALLDDIVATIQDEYKKYCNDHRYLRMNARYGAKACYLQALWGNHSEAREFELFIHQGPLDDEIYDGIEAALLNGGFGLLVDYFAEFFGEFLQQCGNNNGGLAPSDMPLPLDYEPIRIDDMVLLARSELRNYTAERAAAQLLAQADGSSDASSDDKLPN